MEARREAAERAIAVPASTASPLLAAVGLTLLLGGLVTSPIVSATGAAVFLAAAVGWFRQVLPHEQHETVALEAPAPAVAPSSRRVERLAQGAPRHRARLPVETYPISAGLRGGIAGGVAMAALAVMYGLIAFHSPWYTINLLAAAASAELTNASPEVLASFSAKGFALAFAIHAAISSLVGLLYGVLLPMLPRHPVWWGGLVAPLLWSALLAATLDILDPALEAQIHWGWFVASQIAFGITAGLVVIRSERIPTAQHASFAQRAGLETQDE